MTNSLDYLKIASLLKTEADYIIKENKIIEILGNGAKLYFTGSYYLDLMVYPDIDIYLEADSISALEHAAKVSSEYIVNPNTTRVKVEKTFHLIRPGFPKGTALSLKFNTDNWKQVWKFDIWYFDDKDLTKRLYENTQLYKSLLNDKNREIILSLKHNFITSEGKSSRLGSYNIYDAVLKYDVSSLDELKSYLTSIGIDYIPYLGQHSVVK